MRTENGAALRRGAERAARHLSVIFIPLHIHQTAASCFHPTELAKTVWFGKQAGLHFLKCGGYGFVFSETWFGFGLVEAQLGSGLGPLKPGRFGCSESQMGSGLDTRARPPILVCFGGFQAGSCRHVNAELSKGT